MAEKRLCACICVHDDVMFLPAVLQQLGTLPIIVAISDLNWKGKGGEVSKAREIAKAFGAIVYEGSWPNEETHRQAAYMYCQQLGFQYSLVLDSDEVIEPSLLTHLASIAESNLADRVYVEWDTYWKYIDFVIHPRERFTPCLMINLKNATYERVREFSGGKALFLPAEYGIVHHLSYVGGDDRIKKKITTWGHSTEVDRRWWSDIWQTWDQNPFLLDLHPTHPSAYKQAIARSIPPILLPLADAFGVNQTDRQVDFQWPMIRVVIPAHNRQEDLSLCLESLLKTNLELEIVVVDNGSSPPISTYDGVKVIRNEVNQGFSQASNLGAVGFQGDFILFLNSDTIVTRASLIELVRANLASKSIAACGPITNYAGHFQQVQAQYELPGGLGALTYQIAKRDNTIRETDMLVGFCMLVRKSVLDEVGLFDEQFGIGLFEDNDLSYRMRRAGFRLHIVLSSFIHHSGSKTFEELAHRNPEDVHFISALMESNQKLFERKWRRDIQSGFASHLSGLSPDSIHFDSSRSPEILENKLENAKKRANISLCMIVKDEERAIADCLESVAPFCSEIWVLDTGSTDRTVELSLSLGAQVSKTQWPDSFALARNESMRRATGDWILWVDADDTMPYECGLHLLELVPTLPDDVVGVIVPVRFVEHDGFGTEVDHVKLFRNLPGLEWEGRIHEQILPSLRRCATAQGIENGGKIIRSSAFVLHSGYDTSEEGQARKRKRDEHLLNLDLSDRPGHPFVLFNLGMTAHYTGNHEDAIHWLNECLQNSDPTESHVRKAYVLLASSQYVLESAEQAIETLHIAWKAVGDDPEILFHLAKFYSESGNVQSAIELYSRIPKCDHTTYFKSVDPAIFGYKLYHNLALCYLQIGNYPAAKDEWQKAISHSGRLEVAASLFEAALDQNDLATCAGLLEWIRSQFGFTESWALNAARLLNTMKIDPVPLLASIVEENPSESGVRTVLATQLLNSNRAHQALPQLLALDRQGRPEGAFFLGALSEERGEMERARLWYQRSLSLNPGHSPTLERLENLSG